MAEVCLEIVGECKDLSTVAQNMEALIEAYDRFEGSQDNQYEKDFINGLKANGLKFELKKDDDVFNTGDESIFYNELLRITDINLKRKRVTVNLQTGGYFSKAVIRFYESYLLTCGCHDAWGDSDCDEWEDEELL